MHAPLPSAPALCLFLPSEVLASFYPLLRGLLYHELASRQTGAMDAALSIWLAFILPITVMDAAHPLELADGRFRGSEDLLFNRVAGNNVAVELEGAETRV